MEYRKKQTQVSIEPSFCGKTQQITNQRVNSSRVTNSQEQYNLYLKYVQAVEKCFFNRSLTAFSNRSIFDILFHCDLSTRFNLGLVSKAFNAIIYTVNVEHSYTPLLNRATSQLVSNSSKERRITPDMINKLPLHSYQGIIEVIALPDLIGRAVEVLANENLLGFDTETRPSFRKGEVYLPSLIQLATADKVYIFQLHLINQLRDRERLAVFAPLFENARIIKAGVGIQNDMKQLKMMGSFNPRGFVDISSMKGCHNIVNKGLRGLAALLLEVRISKKMQMSNWSNQKLSVEQINYAATDASISRELYLKLDTL